MMCSGWMTLRMSEYLVTLGEVTYGTFQTERAARMAARATARARPGEEVKVLCSLVVYVHCPTYGHDTFKIEEYRRERKHGLDNGRTTAGEQPECGERDAKPSDVARRDADTGSGRAADNTEQRTTWGDSGGRDADTKLQPGHGGPDGEPAIPADRGPDGELTRSYVVVQRGGSVRPHHSLCSSDGLAWVANCGCDTCNDARRAFYRSAGKRGPVWE